MQKLRYIINKNDSINRFWLTDINKTPFSSPCQSFDSDINQGEGYVQIIYPVRESFLASRIIKKVEIYKGEYNKLYFPFENNRVEFSDFNHTPHYLSCYGTVDILSDNDYIAEFDLYTCGGVKIWLNGLEIECYMPYTRNIASCKRIFLSLSKGINTLIIYFDELAERDVFYYFDLRYQGVLPIKIELDVDGQPNIIENIEEVLKSCYFTKDIYDEDLVTLGYDNTLISDDIQIEIISDLNSRKCVLNKAQSTLDIEGLLGFKPQDKRIKLVIQHNGISIIRELLISLYPKELKLIKPKQDINERKIQALEFVSKLGADGINKTIAILQAEGKMTDKARDCLNISLDYIKEKRDCADFYLPLFLRLLRDYTIYLTPDLISEIKHALINFRYWIDELGNDVMWYFSENHAFLFHVSQYLTGNMYPDAVFSASGRKGFRQYQIGKQRLIEWFELFSKYGYAEWNSVSYIPIDLIGLFALYDMAPDEDIRQMARKGLDFTFDVIKFNTFNGFLCSSYGRAYEVALKFRHLNEVNFIEWITTGKGYINSYCHAITSYAISNYIPTNKVGKLKGNFDTIIKLSQGINQANIYNYITKDYCMTSAVGYRPYEIGHQQHLQNIALGNDAVPMIINHSGEKVFSGCSRPSYWAGNGTMPLIHQYRDLQLMVYKIKPESLIHYIHAYTPLYDYDSYKVVGNWFFGQSGEALVGVYFTNGLTITEYGANKGKELISNGLNQGVLLRCGITSQFGSLKEFADILSSAKIDYEKDKLSFNDPHYGLLSIQGNDFTHNGVVVDYQMTNSFLIERV